MSQSDRKLRLGAFLQATGHHFTNDPASTGSCTPVT